LTFAIIADKSAAKFLSAMIAENYKFGLLHRLGGGDVPKAHGYAGREAEAILLRTLREHSSRRLRASELKALTGVAKSRVRGILSGASGVRITREKGSYWFQSV
jgi:hypothetical protein